MTVPVLKCLEFEKKIAEEKKIITEQKSKMATKQKRSNPFKSIGFLGKQNAESDPNQQNNPPPALFDLFYEEFLGYVTNDKKLSEKLLTEFVALKTDTERVEYLIDVSPTIKNFELKTKLGTKSLEQSVKCREEGNKLFQADQTMQSILFYNKSIALAPHPTIEEYFAPPPQPEKITSVHIEKEGAPKKSVGEKKKKAPPAKYEPLALSYANRSAALRRLCQYEECLIDIARAAKFGYPKENVFKLWERKGKCYQGLKRYELATKCLRQAVQSLKEANMTDNQKTLKTHELQSLLKEWRNTHLVMQMAEGNIPSPLPTPQKEEPMMGATGPLVLIKEAPPSKRKTSVTAKEPPPPSSPAPPPAGPTGHPPRPQRPQSMRRKNPSVSSEHPHLEQLVDKTPRNGDIPFRPSVSSDPGLGPHGNNMMGPGMPMNHPGMLAPHGNTVMGPDGTIGPAGTPMGHQGMMAAPMSPDGSMIHPSSHMIGPGSSAPGSPMVNPAYDPMVGAAHGPRMPPPRSPVSPIPPPGHPPMRKSNSQMSISQISAQVKVDGIEVPELSYGWNPRMPSASVGIDLKFSQEKGRFFVASRDLLPGKR